MSQEKLAELIGIGIPALSNIECGKALPSMSVFFFMCEYLQISPSDFFDVENENPEKLRQLIMDLKKLDDEQLDLITAMVKNLLKAK